MLARQFSKCLEAFPGSPRFQDKYQDLYGSNTFKAKNQIHHFGYDRNYSPIYAIYGYEIPTDDIMSLKMNLVGLLAEDFINSDYSEFGLNLLFFTHAIINKKHHKSGKNRESQKIRGLKMITFDNFKNQVLEKLQTKYFGFIKNIIVCHEGFLSKSMRIFSFQKAGINRQIIDKLVAYHDNLGDIVKKFGPLFDCQCIPEEVQDYNGSFQWLNFYNNEDKKTAKQKMKKYFSKQKQKNFYKNSLSQYDYNDKDTIPKIITALFQIIAQKYSSIPYIFRKNAESSKLTELQIKLATEKEYRQILSNYDGHILANLLKNILCKLDPPIIRYQLYEHIIKILKNSDQSYKQDNCQTKNKSSKFKKRIISLPSQTAKQKKASKTDHLPQSAASYLLKNLANKQKDLFTQIIKFVKTQILTHQQANKMTVQSISIILTPCLMRPKSYGIQDMQYSQKLAKVIQTIIEKHDYI